MIPIFSSIFGIAGFTILHRKSENKKKAKHWSKPNEIDGYKLGKVIENSNK